MMPQLLLGAVPVLLVLSMLTTALNPISVGELRYLFA